jgi:hypothetical protein
MPYTPMSIASIDMAIPQKLMGTRPRPGTSREIHNAGILLFEGTSPSKGNSISHHHFLVEFGTENAAAALANWLWSTLHGHTTTLKIGDQDVPIQNGAIKRALIAGARE